MRRFRHVAFGAALFAATPAIAAPSLDNQCFVEGLSGSWDDKGGRASSYTAGCCEYRVYKPDQSHTSDGGLYVTFQMDHMRRFAKDDHAVIQLWFDSDARLEASRVQVEIAGEISFDVETGDRDIDQATKLANDIYGFIQTLGGAASAGRLYFSSDIQQNINRADQCTLNR